MAEQGYLAIADITGYTAYLNESELEHAQDSLSTILNLLIDQTKPPPVTRAPEYDRAHNADAWPLSTSSQPGWSGPKPGGPPRILTPPFSGGHKWACHSPAYHTRP